MRAAVFLAVCFSLVAIAWGNNLIMGRRQPGEILVMDKVITRPRIFGRPQIAWCEAKAPKGSQISFVSVVAWNPWIVSIRPVAGGIGDDSIVVSAIGKPSWGISMRCTVLAVPKKTTTAAPTTTPKTTTPKTTTPETTTPETSTPPSTTTSPPSTTTGPPSTTTGPPSTTTLSPSTTTEPPSTTTWSPSTTTEPPNTTTWSPSTTTEPPSTTNEEWTTYIEE
ncbi:uncharacterized protein LOC143365482 [Halictus rubicundus]|uniref:uncharacterized protein LOC143365482 n=1 Tax=Halictus rubicundus TaxID=77578 RepID=UPI0040359425